MSNDKITKLLMALVPNKSILNQSLDISYDVDDCSSIDRDFKSAITTLEYIEKRTGSMYTPPDFFEITKKRDRSREVKRIHRSTKQRMSHRMNKFLWDEYEKK
jgi:hypothetical protein